MLEAGRRTKETLESCQQDSSSGRSPPQNEIGETVRRIAGSACRASRREIFVGKEKRTPSGVRWVCCGCRSKIGTPTILKLRFRPSRCRYCRSHHRGWAGHRIGGGGISLLHRASHPWPCQKSLARCLRPACPCL